MNSHLKLVWVSPYLSIKFLRFGTKLVLNFFCEDSFAKKMLGFVKFVQIEHIFKLYF